MPFCASTTGQRAQALADTLSPDPLHRILDRYAQQCCPVLDVFAQSYHWSFMQVEYATDLVFRTPAILKPLYQQLSRQAILTVKAEHVATFLGHKITAQLAQEIGSQFTTRIEGTCVKHRFGNSSIKIYDKFGLVLRIETTTNDVSAFKHYRKVEHRQGPATRALAPVRKTIYSLNDLREILLGCNRRYLEYLSSLDDFSAGIRALDRLTQPRPVKGRNLKGLNFFSRAEQTLLAALQRPGFNIAGLRRADLLPLLAQSSPATLSRQLARLRHLGVIKRVTRHLPLLPHPRWPRRHRCRPPPHRTHHHSCSGLTNLLTRCKHSARKRLKRPCRGDRGTAQSGRVGMWRGGVRSTMSVAAPFVWRCLSGSAITPFPHPAHRTQQADFPHCALGQDLTPSPTTGRGRAGSDVRARSTRRGARVDSSRPCVA